MRIRYPFLNLARTATTVAALVALASCTRPAPPPTARTFDTPESAVQALVEAAKAKNLDDVVAIFGPEGRDAARRWPRLCRALALPRRRPLERSTLPRARCGRWSRRRKRKTSMMSLRSSARRAGIWWTRPIRRPPGGIGRCSRSPSPSGGNSSIRRTGAKSSSSATRHGRSRSRS